MMEIESKTSEEAALRLTIALMLDGDSCPYCGHYWTREDADADLVASDVDLRPAHRECWERHKRTLEGTEK